jgi:hypothetical protein
MDFERCTKLAAEPSSATLEPEAHQATVGRLERATLARRAATSCDVGVSVVEANVAAPNGAHGVNVPSRSWPNACHCATVCVVSIQ